MDCVDPVFSIFDLKKQYFDLKKSKDPQDPSLKIIFLLRSFKKKVVYCFCEKSFHFRNCQKSLDPVDPVDPQNPEISWRQLYGVEPHFSE